MLLTLLDIVIPVLAISALGFIFGKRQKRAPDMDFINYANVHIFCPALIFSALIAHPLSVGTAWPLIIAGVLIILVPGLMLAFIRPQGVSRAAFLVTGMFRNTGNTGIPLMMLAYGRDLLGDIVLLFVLSNSLHFSLGLFLLSGRGSRWLWLRNPNVWAAILGISLAPWRAHIPAFMETSIDMVGQITIPLMLFSLGVRLSQDRITHLGLALRINGLYLLTGLVSLPLIVWALPLTPEWTRMIVLSGLLPPAVLNYLLCEQYKVDPAIVASVVLLGNVLSIATIPLVIGFTLVAF